MKTIKYILCSLLILSTFGIFTSFEKSQVLNLTANTGFSKHIIFSNNKNYDLKELYTHGLNTTQRVSNSYFKTKKVRSQNKTTDKKHLTHLLAQKEQSDFFLRTELKQQNDSYKSMQYALNSDVQTSRFNTTFSNKRTSSNLIALNTFNSLKSEGLPTGTDLNNMDNPDLPLQEDFICLSSLLILFYIYKKRIS